MAITKSMVKDEILLDRIKAYWEKRGYKVNGHVEPILLSAFPGITTIKTDMRNGYPRGYKNDDIK